MGAQDISWGTLVLSYILIIIPISLSFKYKMGITKDTLISIARMTLQLFLLGFYLEFLFELNHWAVNLCWILIMLLVTAWTTLQRAQLNIRKLFLPVFVASLIAVLTVDLLVLKMVLRLDNVFEAGYLIPISGMLLGNILSDMVISLTYFYTHLKKQIGTYRYALANGATQSEALALFMRDAIKISLNRGLASTAVMGLVSLPGMMTGQILGGSSPQVAIKYQILIMLTIFVTSSTAIFLMLLFTRKKAFDSYLNLKEEIFESR